MLLLCGLSGPGCSLLCAPSAQSHLSDYLNLRVSPTGPGSPEAGPDTEEEKEEVIYGRAPSVAVHLTCLLRYDLHATIQSRYVLKVCRSESNTSKSDSSRFRLCLYFLTVQLWAEPLRASLSPSVKWE